MTSESGWIVVASLQAPASLIAPDGLTVFKAANTLAAASCLDLGVTSLNIGVHKTTHQVKIILGCDPAAITEQMELDLPSLAEEAVRRVGRILRTTFGPVDALETFWNP